MPSGDVLPMARVIRKVWQTATLDSDGKYAWCGGLLLLLCDRVLPSSAYDACMRKRFAYVACFMSPAFT